MSRRTVAVGVIRRTPTRTTTVCATPSGVTGRSTPTPATATKAGAR